MFRVAADLYFCVFVLLGGTVAYQVKSGVLCLEGWQIARNTTDCGPVVALQT
jgi:hypothetical protein